MFGDRWKRDLFWMLVVKEITIKYRRSVLGVFWSVVNPVFTAAVLVVAFTVFMRFDKPDYALFLLSALFLTGDLIAIYEPRGDLTKPAVMLL